MQDQVADTSHSPTAPFHGSPRPWVPGDAVGQVCWMPAVPTGMPVAPYARAAREPPLETAPSPAMQLSRETEISEVLQ